MTPEDVTLLHERHARGLFLLARSVTGDDHLAEDALQMIFARLLERGEALPVPAYLYRSVRNAALNLLRGRGRAARRERAVGAARPLFEAPRDRLADREALEVALATLPDEQRECVLLKVWGGLTLAEIGETVGVGANTAASRYRYGMERLRAAMTATEDRSTCETT